MAMQPNPVGWFEIPVADMPRAIKFYEQAFDVKLSQAEMGGHPLAFFPMEKNANGAAGTLIQIPQIKPSHDGTTVYFRVEAIDAALAKIAKAGGKTLIPRRDIGEYGFFAQFEDSEGNRAALHECHKG